MSILSLKPLCRRLNYKIGPGEGSLTPQQILLDYMLFVTHRARLRTQGTGRRYHRVG